MHHLTKYIDKIIDFCHKIEDEECETCPINNDDNAFCPYRNNTIAKIDRSLTLIKK